MARINREKVYLGYIDEYVTDKYRSFVNFTTNKIGGKPDWPHEKCSVSVPRCKACGLFQILSLQIYVPLENSKYHRTLYIFTCLNSNCWCDNASWTCIRVQLLDETNLKSTPASSSVVVSATSWLADADDWGNDSNDNASEENGNNVVWNQESSSVTRSSDNWSVQDLLNDFTKLHPNDPNANSPTSIESPVVGEGGAVARLDSPHASAEIEGEENEVICIDTPTKPQCDLIDLLNEVSTVPATRTESELTFTEIFISVDEEDCSIDIPQHVHDLILEYQQANPEAIQNTFGDSGAEKETDTSLERYEKGIPAHNDEMFHDFKSRLQINPEQILRYCRDNRGPLLLYPKVEGVSRCKHCGGDMTFELQILPTIIPKLKLNTDEKSDFELEFGTVLIFTCVNSCWSPTDTFKEEQVVVQMERLY